MKFYDCTPVPSPRRVRVFLAEKGITVPTVQVDLYKGEQFGEAFRAINPDCTVPVLELDDGTRITDAIGICRYFEIAQPSPPLMGRNAAEAGIIETWQRWAERDGFYAVVEAFRNTTPAFEESGIPGPDRYAQIPELGARGHARIGRFFERLDARLGESEFVGGAGYSIADITAMISVDFAGWVKLKPGENQTHLNRWYAAVSARASAKA